MKQLLLAITIILLTSCSTHDFHIEHFAKLCGGHKEIREIESFLTMKLVRCKSGETFSLND